MAKTHRWGRHTMDPYTQGLYLMSVRMAQWLQHQAVLTEGRISKLTGSRRFATRCRISIESVVNEYLIQMMVIIMGERNNNYIVSQCTVTCIWSRMHTRKINLNGYHLQNGANKPKNEKISIDEVNMSTPRISKSRQFLKVNIEIKLSTENQGFLFTLLASSLCRSLGNPFNQYNFKI